MKLLAGAATSDITPGRPVFLAGYPHVPRTSTGVHDPLLVCALCLKDGDRGVVVASIDTLFLDPPSARELRARVAARAGVAEECVLVSCTHTHSGPLALQMLSWRADPVVPPVDPRLVDEIVAGAVAAAGAAAERMRPAGIAWTTARADGLGGNRLAGDGPCDPEVGILVVRDAGTGRAIALDVTYAMHPTVLHEDSTLVSADFPAYVRAAIGAELGAGAVVVYHTGTAGDQSPRRFVRAQTFAEAERLGSALGRRILDAVAAVAPGAPGRGVALAGARAAVDLPARTMPSLAAAEDALRRARSNWERLRDQGAPHAAVRTAECTVFGAEESVTLARAAASGDLAALVAAYRHAEVQAVRIGDGVIVGLPGEVFVEYGLAIKRAAPAVRGVACLANGELQGYIVTPGAAAAGGYEAGTALFAPGAGRILVEAATGLAGALGG